MSTATVTTRRASRFSLLLLEHSEVLLSDFAVQYRFIPDATAASSPHPLTSLQHPFVKRSANTITRGRIKLATHSLFFDNDDWRYPIIRLPLLSVQLARLTRDHSRSHDGNHSKNTTAAVSTSSPPSSSSFQRHEVQSLEDEDDDNSVLILATSATFQRELAIDHPYIDVQIRGRHIFTPLYASALTLLDDINTLLHITSTSSPRIRNQRLKQLVQEREALVPFDITLLQHGVKENAIMDAPVSAVYPMSTQPGRFRITADNIYFMPVHGESSQSVERVPVTDITTLRTLRHGCRDAAIEITYRRPNDLPSSPPFATLMVSFPSCQLRERAINVLKAVTPNPIEQYLRRDLESALAKWRVGEMSNFDYLMYLNLASGRSFNDLSQYPVFPWVIQDYTSAVLDLTNPDTFRDLSKPIGALDGARLQNFIQRYHEMSPPRFFYGTHYSTPAYIINYLVRAAPAAMLRLQNGRFDIPDRLFHSVASCWRSVTQNRGDVKELIPEFYTLSFSDGLSSGVVAPSSTAGEFLDNVLSLELGTRQDGIPVDDVRLPPWANSSSLMFVHKFREALESDFVSCHLHQWIDLIFGTNSRSADAFNVFYTDVALPESIGANEEGNIQDDEMGQIETVYLEFGRTPQKLFQHPHPPRFGDIIDDINDGELNYGDEPTFVPSEKTSDTRIRKESLTQDIVLEHGKGKHGDIGSFGGDVSWRELAHLDGKMRKTGSSSSLKRSSQMSCGKSDSLPATNRNYLLPMGSAGKSETSSLNSILSYVVDVGENLPLTPSSFSPQTQAHIVDMCIIEDNNPSGKSNVESVMICTIWDNGYLKVHDGNNPYRSKLIGCVCSIAYVGNDTIAYGSRDGNIGLYFIESAHNEIIQEGAHDGEVFAFNVVEEDMLLVSGSKDGSVKLWRFEHIGRRFSKLRLIQEVDGESCVEDVCAILGRGADDGHVLVAAWTSDEILLVWVLETDGGEPFMEPFWRYESDSSVAKDQNKARIQKHVMTWLDQGPTKRPLIVCGSDEHCVQIWRLEPEVLMTGEVHLSEVEVSCLSRSHNCSHGSRTFIVADSMGKISEFDSTGLCVGKISVGDEDIVQVTLNSEGTSLFVWDRADRISCLNISQAS